MLKKFKKLGNNSNDKSEDTTFDDVSLEENLKLLLEESQMTIVNINKIKSLLAKTRQQRIKDVKLLTATKLLEKYPALQDPKLVSITLKYNL